MIARPSNEKNACYTAGSIGLDEVKWLIAKEIPRLRRYALGLADTPEAADDLVQDSLERAIRKRHQWKRHGSIRSWLYRILYNVFLNQTAQRNRERREVDIDELSAPLTEPPQQENQIACREIAAAVRQLPREQRAAIMLTALEGLSYDEAAKIIGVPIGTLRSRLSRGREKLRELYVPETRHANLRRVK
ncbi:MAG: sigma-70 family RNA polymerase sigma factor [Hyphomicrobiales bacterium]|nr:sigma-70 family RNA polymerase sigma factor [Hyphomicrobiales bacterium]